MLQKLIPIKKKVRRLLNKLRGKPERYQGEFYKRITHRHQTFWKAPEAEQVRNTIMHAGDPVEKWQDTVNWQRKLSNKHNSREFATKYGCQVPDLCWYGRDLSTLDFSKLPPQYVIRPTIGYSSKLVFLMDNGFNLMDKQQYTPEAIRELLAKPLAENEKLYFLV